MAPPQEFALDFRVFSESADLRMTSFNPVAGPGGARCVDNYSVDFPDCQIFKIQDSNQIS